MTIASVGVLVACLLLTGMAVLFSLNISNALKEIENDNKITVYLKDDLVTLESVAVGEKMSLRFKDYVCQGYCVYVTPSEDFK